MSPSGILRGLLDLVGYLRYRVAPRPLIVVLGMHRSGTSCVTRMLASLGPRPGDQLLEANAANPRGYWEHPTLLHLHRHLLRAAGGAWDAPPEAVSHTRYSWWKMRLFLGRLHRQGVTLLKDPRMVLAYELWRPLLVAPVEVMVFRHPGSVAASLTRRDQTPAERGLALWQTYNERLLRAAEVAAPAAWIDFDAGPKPMAAALRRVAAAARLPYDAGIEDLYEPALRSSDSLQTELPADVEAVYATLRTCAGTS